MLKRLSSMSSMKRISSAFVDVEEPIDDGMSIAAVKEPSYIFIAYFMLGFVPFDVKSHGIQEISVADCERRKNVLLFSIEV